MDNMLTQLLEVLAQRKTLLSKYGPFCGEFSCFLCFHGVSSHSLKTSRSSNWETALLELTVICPVGFVAFTLNHSGISSRPPVIQREQTNTYKIDCFLSSLSIICFFALKLWSANVYFLYSAFFCFSFCLHLTAVFSCSRWPLYHPSPSSLTVFLLSLFSYTVQVQAACCPSRSWSFRLLWQVSWRQHGSVAEVPKIT